ncbi:cuticle protein LPCP-23-like [Bacillus rossius redtenbacheri]|uniref:cuticle protein LPCP-23-like n=1 Tax=Bacillus rossius redtenbacheri TaxID=93214 RepID=UPI002FDDFE5B
MATGAGRLLAPHGGQWARPERWEGGWLASAPGVYNTAEKLCRHHSPLPALSAQQTTYCTMHKLVAFFAVLAVAAAAPGYLGAPAVATYAGPAVATYAAPAVATYAAPAVAPLAYSAYAAPAVVAAHAPLAYSAYAAPAVVKTHIY